MLTLNELYDQSKLWEEIALDRIKNYPEISIEPDIIQLWHRNQIEALHAIFVEKNGAGYKNNFYICGRLDEYMITGSDSRILDSGVKNLTSVLLSDNIELINRFANLGHSVYMWMVEHGHSTLLYCIQQVIKEDWKG